MALFRKDQYNGEVLIASAEKIELDKAGRVTGAQRRTPKEEKAWEHYRGVPEIWFGTNYVANALRRVNLYPAIQPDPMKPPVPLGPDDGPIAARANAELDRLRDVDGTFGSITHDLAMQLSIPGQGQLCGYVDPETNREVWGIYSMSELVQQSGEWLVKSGKQDGNAKRLPDDAHVWRIWRPDPEWRRQADSPFFPLSDTLTELLLLDRMYRSYAKSGVGNGLLVVPDEVKMRPPQVANQQAGPPQGAEMDPLVKALLMAMTAPLEDEASALNVAPGVFKMPGDLIEKIKHLIFARSWDAETAARYDKLINKVAAGVDMPPEVILGIQDLNHWSAWQIGEDAFNTHLAPLVQLMCSGLTMGFMNPALSDLPPDSERVFIWYDASAITTRPPAPADVNQAFDRVAISWEAYRNRLNLNEDEAPTPEEVALRQQLGLVKQAAAPAPGQGGPPPSDVTAAASPASVNVGRRLADVDRELRDQLVAACESVVSRSLSAIGRSVEAKAMRSGVDAYVDALALIPHREHAAALGQPALEWLGMALDDDVDAAASSVLGTFGKLVRRAQAKVRKILRDEYGMDTDDLEAKQEEGVSKAGVVLVAGLASIIKSKLFPQEAHAPAQRALTEVAGETIVPPGLIRQVVTVAGGDDGATAVVHDLPDGGVATGPDVMAELELQVSVTPNAWVWVYGDGDRKTPFEGHMNLDGQEFLDWQDPVLAVRDEDAWLGVAYYRPGDHLYCQCDFAPVLEEG